VIIYVCGGVPVVTPPDAIPGISGGSTSNQTYAEYLQQQASGGTDMPGGYFPLPTDFNCEEGGGGTGGGDGGTGGGGEGGGTGGGGTGNSLAAKIIKISATDGQYGTVGKELSQPLEVFVLDSNNVPVQDATVTFQALAGGGNFNGAQTYSVSTDQFGIAKAYFTLGKYTNDNPDYRKLASYDEFDTRIGVNIITASVNSSSGSITLSQPFEAYGIPDWPDQIKKVLGDGNTAMVNNPGGTLSAQIIDQYGNPISNLNITFKTINSESIYPDVPLPSVFRKVQFYKYSECKIPYPLFGECGTLEEVTVKTDYNGASVGSILGNTIGTKYTVEARNNESGIPPVNFNLYTEGYRNKDDYIPPGMYIKYLQPVNDKGESVNASKVNTELKAPLVSELFLLYDDYTLDGPYTCGGINCWKLKPSGIVNIKPITDGTVTYTPVQGDGTVMPTENLGNGKYQARYITGPVPMENIIEALGTATVTLPEVLLDPFVVNCTRLLPNFFGYAPPDLYKPLCKTAITDYSERTLQCAGGTCELPTRSVTLKSGQQAVFQPSYPSNTVSIAGIEQKATYKVYGVLPEITEILPDVMILDPVGYLIQDTSLKYSIDPSGYNALTVDIDIYERTQGSTDDVYDFSLTGSAVQLAGTATVYQGEYFDPTKEYYAEVVLNRGSDVEIRGDRTPLPLTPIHVELTDSAGNIINPNDYVYITDVPQMPQLTARLKPEGLSGNVNWSLKISYKRYGTVNGQLALVRNDSDSFPSSGSVNLPVDTLWNLNNEIGSMIRGGKATITWELVGVTSPQDFVFHIRGTNPTESTAENYIGTTPWFIRGIAKQESGAQNGRTYLQFNEVGTLGPNWSDSKYCPNWGYPHGWGMMQIEDPLSAAVLWDWQINIDVGKYILQQKHGEIDSGAHDFWARQVDQFERWNLLNDPDVAAPADTTFNGYAFAYAPTGTQKSYEDAIWIKYYNGAYQGHYIAWDNITDPNHPQWVFHRLNKDGYDYVEAVCKKLP
jgi:hypothetical protein